MTKKQFLTGSIIIAIAFLVQPLSLLFVQVNIAPLIAESVTGQNSDGSISSAGMEIKTENLKVNGNPDAQIYLVEFSDYECPFCQRFHNTPKEIVANSGGKVAWVWKHFPLQFHPNAKPASIAAECVNKIVGSEKFWKFSDALIANQTTLSETLMRNEAAKLGVNAAAFNACIKDESIAALVEANANEGAELGVNGTPSTFVVKNENGKLTVLENINGALPKETVESIIAKYSE